MIVGFDPIVRLGNYHAAIVECAVEFSIIVATFARYVFWVGNRANSGANVIK